MAEPEVDNGVSLVNMESRPGQYQTPEGVWLRDRRFNADRRADRIVELHIRGMRTQIRRRSDHEMWAYLASASSEMHPDIRHVRSIAS